jgi:hypothetical protein
MTFNARGVFAQFLARRGERLGHFRQNVHARDAGLFNRLGHQACGMPLSLRSSWKPVMPFSVPAILQSMSQ